MRWTAILTAMIVFVLAACWTHPRSTTPPASGAALPDDGRRIASLFGRRCTGESPVYRVDVYDDGTVAWSGDVAVRSVGARRRHLDEADFAELRKTLGDALAIRPPVPPRHEGCEAKPSTELWYYHRDQYYPHELLSDCASDATLGGVVSRVAEILRVETWIHGNPPGPGGALPDGDHLLMTLRRGVCYGDCPIFTVTVFDDGTVVWDGERHVASVGERRARLSADAVAEIDRAFVDARFFEMNELGKIPVPPPPCPEDQVCPRQFEGTISCTDTSHSVITYHQRGHSKTLENAHCEDNALSRLEVQVAALIGLRRWIGR